MFRRIATALSLIALAAPAQAIKEEVATAEYAISIAGLEIGETKVRLKSAPGAYDLTFEGGFEFLFWRGVAAGHVSGARGDGRLDPARYWLLFDGPTRVVETTIGFADGRPAEWGVSPPPEPEWIEGRVPIADADLDDAVDPVTAFLIVAEAPDEACSRSVKVFSGFVRFDLTLTPGAVAADGVIECRVSYSPVSGHRAESDGVARLRERGMEVSLYQIAEGVWAPHRLGFPTSVGTLSFERRL